MIRWKAAGGVGGAGLVLAVLNAPARDAGGRVKPPASHRGVAVAPDAR